MKIQKCYVCDAEDQLGDPRGSQSHPIFCEWRVGRENEGYRAALEYIYKFCCNTEFMSSVDPAYIIGDVRKLALGSLTYRYDMDWSLYDGVQDENAF